MVECRVLSYWLLHFLEMHPECSLLIWVLLHRLPPDGEFESVWMHCLPSGFPADASNSIYSLVEFLNQHMDSTFYPIDEKLRVGITCKSYIPIPK